MKKINAILPKLNESLKLAIYNNSLLVSEIKRKDLTTFMEECSTKIESNFPLFSKARYILESSVKRNNGEPELILFLSKKGKILFYAYTDKLPGLEWLKLTTDIQEIKTPLSNHSFNFDSLAFFK